ncbi:hypothetical protein TRFO_22939 [Tritrichomonas foetus]|uniref:Uncharacterized protein n=1 Tax=Tritrichomonas foetus TaxID=1144522 RepID=A0A1J4KGR5_9EUKA|nr:hypothetical protein TRFO_22939 [Tritrichomonas foetus]|eukprot:OHT08517.1 hypothetical protein TRFO_22939 [Tritrichomonas foetus]
MDFSLSISRHSLYNLTMKSRPIGNKKNTTLLIPQLDNSDEVIITSKKVTSFKNFVQLIVHPPKGQNPQFENLSQIKTLRLDNTKIGTFDGAIFNIPIKNLSMLNTPLSHYSHYRLMALIVFGAELETIDHNPIKKSERQLFEKNKEVLYDYLVEGWILTMLSPLKLYHPETRQRRVLYPKNVDNVNIIQTVNHMNHPSSPSISPTNSPSNSPFDSHSKMSHCNSPSSKLSPGKKPSPIRAKDVSVFSSPLNKKNSSNLSLQSEKTSKSNFKKNLTSKTDTDIEFLKILEKNFFEDDLRKLNISNFGTIQDNDLFVYYILLCVNLRPFFVKEIVEFLKSVTTPNLIKSLKKSIQTFKFSSYSVIALLIEELLSSTVFTINDVKPLLFSAYSNFESWNSYFSLFDNHSVKFIDFFCVFSNIIEKVDPELYNSLIKLAEEDNSNENGVSLIDVIQKFKENDRPKFVIFEALLNDDVEAFSEFDDDSIKQNITELTPWESPSNHKLLAASFCGAIQCFNSIIQANSSVQGENDNEETKNILEKLQDNEILISAAIAGGNFNICKVFESAKDYLDVAVTFHQFHLFKDYFELVQIEQTNLSSLFYHSVDSINITVIDYLMDKQLHLNHDSVLERGISLLFPSFVTFLLDYGFKSNFSLIYAIKAQKLEIVKLFSSAEFNIKGNDKLGWTPIHYAAQMGNVNILSYILSKCQGIDINLKDNEGNSPLLIAASNNHSKIVSALLKRNNCNPNLADNNGWTPLHIAAGNRNQEIVKTLIFNSKTNANAKTFENKETPLIIAAEANDEKIVGIILRKPNVDVNAKTKNNETALTLAIRNRNKAIIELIIKCGRADIAGINISQLTKDVGIQSLFKKHIK